MGMEQQLYLQYIGHGQVTLLFLFLVNDLLAIMGNVLYNILGV